MNNGIRTMNKTFCRQPIDIEAMKQTQRNNKRTVIDPDRVDFTRMTGLTRMMTEDTELGMMIRPLPYAEIAGDTPDTLNMVMQALGLYTFPTQELVDWLHSEIDDDAEASYHPKEEAKKNGRHLSRSISTFPSRSSDMPMWAGMT